MTKGILLCLKAKCIKTQDFIHQMNPTSTLLLRNLESKVMIRCSVSNNRVSCNYVAEKEKNDEQRTLPVLSQVSPVTIC